MVKHAVLFSMDNGAVGRYVGVERVTDHEVNVLYYPSGFTSVLGRGLRKIERVPTSAVRGPYHPPGCPYEEGVVVLLAGSLGRSYLADNMGLDVSRRLVRLEKEKALIEMESQMKTAKIEDKAQGARSELKRIKESMDTIDKARKRDVFGEQRRKDTFEY